MNLDDLYDDDYSDDLYESICPDDDIKKSIHATEKIDFQKKLTQLEIEDERSNGNRDVYINRELIFSNRYIDAIKTLGENRYCTKNIVNATRTMLEHHHGDKYEDLYFIDSRTNKMLSRTDYRVNEQEVLPTSAMKKMAKDNSNIISIHNHPTDALPSYEDIKTCYLVGYKYGLIACHSGDLFQYKTLDEINKVIYETECSIYYKREHGISEKFKSGEITKEQFELEHQKSFIELSAHLIDAGVIIKEVLWNGNPQRQRDVTTNKK